MACLCCCCNGQSFCLFSQTQQTTGGGQPVTLCLFSQTQQMTGGGQPVTLAGENQIHENILSRGTVVSWTTETTQSPCGLNLVYCTSFHPTKFLQEKQTKCKEAFIVQLCSHNQFFKKLMVQSLGTGFSCGTASFTSDLLASESLNGNATSSSFSVNKFSLVLKPLSHGPGETKSKFPCPLALT